MKVTPEAPLGSKKLDMIGSINLGALVKRARLPEDLHEKYERRVRDLQVKVAGEIRDKSREKAEEHVRANWDTLVLDAYYERVARERRALKADLEKTGKAVILEEEKTWKSHHDRPRNLETGKVAVKCLSCPTPAVMIEEHSTDMVEICIDGRCQIETRNELYQAKKKANEEKNRRHKAEWRKVVDAGEAGDREWFRFLLFHFSLTHRPNYLDNSNSNDRWRQITEMTLSEVLGWLLSTCVQSFVRPTMGSEEYDIIQCRSWIADTYGVDRDFLFPHSEDLPGDIQKAIREASR